MYASIFMLSVLLFVFDYLKSLYIIVFVVFPSCHGIQFISFFQSQKYKIIDHKKEKK